MKYQSDKTWNITDAIKNGPFEYDQGDTLKVYYDDLYNLWVKAGKPE